MFFSTDQTIILAILVKGPLTTICAKLFPIGPGRSFCVFPISTQETLVAMLSEATSSLFPIKVITKLERT